MTPGSGLFGAQREARQHVGAEVDGEHLQGAERHEADAGRRSQKTNGKSSAMLCEKMYVTIFLTLAYTPRPCSTALTMLAKLSSSRIMVAASREPRRCR